MKNAVIFSGLVIGAMLTAVVASPIIVSAISNFLDLERVLVRKNPSGLDAIFKTHGLIPQNGNGNPPAFGYGLLTSAPLSDGIIVSTTHKGVLDSATQNGNPNNPIFHNHFITLKAPPPNCPDPDAVAAVDEITFESPGQIRIKSTDALQARIPNTFTGTDSFTGDPLTLTPGNDVEDAVSFKLDPIFQGNTLVDVCVTITDAAEANQLFVR